MTMPRRAFLHTLMTGAAASIIPVMAQAREPKSLPPNAVGILYDATLCIGCKACEVGCKQANAMPMAFDTPMEQAHGVSGVWDAADDLNSITLNKIKLYTAGAAAIKDTEQDGFSFIKRACMHCVDPNCVSACPVSALTKNPITGIVQYNADACIGCRYCQLACPFNIPKFEYDKPFPKIVKCQLCNTQLAQGGIPACCSACPTGASLFGRVSELKQEGHARLTAPPGQQRDYPVHQLGGDNIQHVTVTPYYPKIYGETDAGGTQYLLLAGVPFEKLGLPQLGDQSRAQLSETIQHTLYHGMIAPTALLGGLVYAVYRNTHAEQPCTLTPNEEQHHD